MESWIFGMGGVICNFGFGLREKIWKFGFLGWGWGGVICNFGFGLREKIWIFGKGGVICNFGFSKFPNFFPKSKSEVADYPPHPKNPNFQIFFLSPNPKLQITPPTPPHPKNPNFQIFSLSPNPKLQITPPFPKIQISKFFS